VKRIRGLSFYNIVPVEHLLHRLANDCNRPSVCTAMTSLLVNSYHPQKDKKTKDNTVGITNTELLRRCLTFIRQHQKAAIAFYSYIHKEIAVGSVAKLSVLLLTRLMSYAESEHNESQLALGKNKRSRNVSLYLYILPYLIFSAILILVF
jgi:hypothetical protein